MSEHDLFPQDEQEEAEESDLPAEVPGEVPEADAAEQTRPLAGSGHSGTDEVGDRPEADALDQDRIEDPDEDDDRR
jgi:hypothetical protein